MMTNFTKKKRCLDIGIVVLVIIFASALVLIGICEASGSDTVCRRRRQSPVDDDPVKPGPTDGDVTTKYTNQAFVLVGHYEEAAGLQCLADPVQNLPKEPVTIRTMVVGENHKVVGVSGENSTCTNQASCFLNPESNICTSLERLDPIQVVWGVDASGSIFECDPSDEGDGLEACRLKAGCATSSRYPSCLFQAYTIKDLVENPSVIQRNSPTGVEPFSYLLLYSDPSCSNLQGLRSFEKGPQDIVLAAATALDVSCEDSLVCLSNPTGPKCTELGFNETKTIVTNVRDDGQVVTCDDNSDCNNPVSTECNLSFVSPRVLPAMAFGQNFVFESLRIFRLRRVVVVVDL
jgi:hypothetical protein